MRNTTLLTIVAGLMFLGAPSFGASAANPAKADAKKPSADSKTVSVHSGSNSTDAVKSALSEVNRPVRDKWALVIGIGKFADSSIDLKYAAKDAKDFYDFLLKDGNFAQDHVMLLLDEQATRENILTMLGDKWLPRVAQPDDVVVIYVSSHGSPSNVDVAGVNYIVAHNTDKDSLYATGIPIQELSSIIKNRVHSDRVVIILDACHSGAASTDSKSVQKKLNVSADEVVQGTGQLVICSSAPDQISWESRQYENGVFTRHLIDALKTKPKLGEAYDYLKDKVQTEVLKDRAELQVPMLKSKWEGKDLFLSVPPAQPRKPAVDPTLLAARPVPQVKPVSGEVHPTLPRKLTVIPALGPLNLRLDRAWQKWTEETGNSLDTKGELDEIARGLDAYLKQSLEKRGAKELMVPSPVTASDLESKPQLLEQPSWYSIGDQAQSKYILFVTIDDMYIRDKLMSNIRTPNKMSDEYGMYISAKLVEADTGKVDWQVTKRHFNVIPTDRIDPGVQPTLTKWLYPIVCNSICNEVVNALGLKK